LLVFARVGVSVNGNRISRRPKLLHGITSLWRPWLSPGDFAEVYLFGTFDPHFFPMFSPLIRRPRPSQVFKTEFSGRIRTENCEAQLLRAGQDERKLLVTLAREVTYGVEGRSRPCFAEVCVRVITHRHVWKRVAWQFGLQTG